MSHTTHRRLAPAIKTPKAATAEQQDKDNNNKNGFHEILQFVTELIEPSHPFRR